MPDSTLLPDSTSAERNFLGAILTDPRQFREIENLTADDFSLSAHRAMYRGMAAMDAEGIPIEPGLLCEWLRNEGKLGEIGGEAYVIGLGDGCLPESAKHYAAIIRTRARERRALRHIELLTATMALQSPQKMTELRQHVQELLDSLDASSMDDTSIRRFSDIPDVLRMEFPPVEYIVPAIGIARNTITLWTGKDGDGKTFLAQAMACAVARGEMFLGMKCQSAPVLYLDLENPPYVVQDRMRTMAGEEAAPQLRFWGTWHTQQPPQAGSALLKALCRETMPLLIIDPFRYFHEADENESTAMVGIMKYLRACASYGAAVVILHHPAKQEGSTGRGSSAIRGACDLALMHSLDRDNQLITLKVDKNRIGESRTVTIRADFEQGRFQVTDSPYITKRNEEFEKLEAIIAAHPGTSQNGIVEQAGMMKDRALKLLKEGRGTRWKILRGSRNSNLYYPLTGSPVLSGSEAQSQS